MLIRTSLVTVMALGTGLAGLSPPASAALRFAADTAPPGHCNLTSCTAAGTTPGYTTGPGPSRPGGGAILPDLCASDPTCAAGSISGPAPAPVTTADVAQLAMDSMARPMPRIHTSPGARTYVGVTTFLWIDNAQFRPQTATASVANQTVSAKSEPTAVIWNLGETTITCHGPGTPYRPGGPSDQTSDCTYRYRRSSADQPDGEYQISATIQWHVTWTCSGTGCGNDTRCHDLGMTGSRTQAKLAVGEIQTGSQSD